MSADNLCEACDATGWVRENSPHFGSKCFTCRGSGRVPQEFEEFEKEKEKENAQTK